MNVYQIVTEKIIKELEQNKIPWYPQYSQFNGGYRNFISNKEYSGINTLLLGMTGFTNPYFLTFNQVKSLKGSVIKGSKSSMIIFFKWIEKESKSGKDETFPILRYYNVFNVTQTTGIDYDQQLKEYETYNIQPCEDIISGYTNRPDLKHNDQQAYYQTELDYINMPKKETFKIPEAYYHTLFHEMIHSTGHEKRLNRFKNDKDKLNSSIKSYSLEELVAEIGSCFLTKRSNIDDYKYFDNSISYIKGWIKHLRNNPKHIVSAASRAEKACKHILNTE